MMVARKFGFFLSAAIAVAMFASCSGFFTNSLASGLARDQDKLVPEVTTSNVDDLMAQAEGNPEMASAVLGAIEDAMAGATPEEKTVLRVAAVQLASNASGVGVAVLNDAGKILENLDDDNVVSDISKTIDGLSNLESTSATLVAVLPSPDDTAAFDAFAANSTADDMAMAAIVLLSSKAKSSGGTEVYIDTFDSSSTELSAEEKLAVELAKRAKAKNDAEGGDGALADMLDALNLVDL